MRKNKTYLEIKYGCKICITEIVFESFNRSFVDRKQFLKGIKIVKRKSAIVLKHMLFFYTYGTYGSLKGYTLHYPTSKRLGTIKNQRLNIKFENLYIYLPITKFKAQHQNHKYGKIINQKHNLSAFHLSAIQCVWCHIIKEPITFPFPFYMSISVLFNTNAQRL